MRKPQSSSRRQGRKRKIDPKTPIISREKSPKLSDDRTLNDVQNQLLEEGEVHYLTVRKDEIQQRLEQLKIDPFKVHPPKKMVISTAYTLRSNADQQGLALRVPVVPNAIKSLDTHVDYLLKEMQWLATDYASERKRHIAVGRRISAAVITYFQSKEQRFDKIVENAKQKRQKLATRLATRFVQHQFWYRLEKVITYKQKIHMETERNKAMNVQLMKLVKQTAKYSDLLIKDNISNDYEWSAISNADVRNADDIVGDVCKILDTDRRQHKECMANSSGSRQVHFSSTIDVIEIEKSSPLPVMRSELPVVKDSPPHSKSPSSDASCEVDSYFRDDEEEEFVDKEEEVDDETTMEQEEKLPQEMSADEELKLLQQENELSIEELLAKYTGRASTVPSSLSDYNNLEPDRHKENGVDTHFDDNDEEFADYNEEVDDEATMEQEEKLPQEMSTHEELKLLQQENELSIEDLLAKYSDRVSTAPSSSSDDEDELFNRQEANGVDRHFDDFDDDDDDEFDDNAEEFDDETTMEQEERLPQEMSAVEEIMLLQQENEMSIEELLSKYTGIASEDASDHNEGTNKKHIGGEEINDDQSVKGEEKNNYDSNNKKSVDKFDHVASNRSRCDIDPEAQKVVVSTGRHHSKLNEELENIEASKNQQTECTSAVTLECNSTRPPNSAKKQQVIDDSFDSGQAAHARLERSLDAARKPQSNRPFLLAPWLRMREYQQIGLNWLVSLQSRRLNGILADEMGLGKTLQTISLIAYLAAYKGIWGPHLIVVPTSVMLNWETEFKRFCPGLKVLCYYGPAKRRKELRTGWTDSNWAHVVITSYQLSVQDSFAFKRKRWYFLVLDEAQHIKNFQSQRWKTLIQFNSQRRLLLTGTPLQNNLMELWSLLHFLMPHVFRSRKEFSHWFASPMSSIIEGTADQNNDIVNRLHGIIRPFVLRRLKRDVETQMPAKFEHIIKCHLSRRQMLIYEEFMARSSTRQALRNGGNFMGMMNVLMQLRKVCNHPDLFEPRSVVTPFFVDPISLNLPSYTSIVLDSQVWCLDDYMLIPLWAGSQGQPTISKSLIHDRIESDELLEYEAILASLPKEREELLEGFECASRSVQGLVTEVFDQTHADKQSNNEFLNRLSGSRCRRPPFLYTERLLTSVQATNDLIQCQSMDCMSTPQHLITALKGQLQLAKDLDELVKRFVFCVPKAGISAPVMGVKDATSICKVNDYKEMLLEPTKQVLMPFREARIRLSSQFPDKKLVQFDSGKLQILAELLRERKRGGHKVLIFTQMGKMLDILEAFLNLNGHTYLRLDGSTGVERRQRLMDRFNSNPKIFCFILSTRSGGVGINLTGADTVVFYDSDWNPAIDAQAQDRAHRIGQTRDVHIYRLVTEHTVEENILLKAQQKRNLDVLVLDEGKFNASPITQNVDKVGNSPVAEEVRDVYTKKGLMSILGVTDAEYDDIEEDEAHGSIEEAKNSISKDQIEKTMISLEDDEDANALRGVQKEADEELKEFDESIDYTRESDSEDEDETDREEWKKDKGTTDQDKGKEQERELEREFVAWQNQVGMDAAAIEASLSPIERFGLRFREEVDPFYSIYAEMESRRQHEIQSEAESSLEADMIEQQKEWEEHRAIQEGDLLVANMVPESLPRLCRLYRNEKARLRGNRKLRKVTGKDWEKRVNNDTNTVFWYNIDTCEERFEKPDVLVNLDAYKLACERKWIALPSKPLTHVMGFLLPHPDRVRCSLVCRAWRRAANDPMFIRHIYPSEMGSALSSQSKVEYNHFRTIAEAVAHALPGDTLELSDGHYWQNSDLIIEKPLRFVGDENNLSNVVIELSGTVVWSAQGGYFEGITLRRPKIASIEPACTLLRITKGGRIDMIQTALDNEGATGIVVHASGPGYKGTWVNTFLQNGSLGLRLSDNARLSMAKCVIRRNRSHCIECRTRSQVRMMDCIIEENEVGAVKLTDSSTAIIDDETFSNSKGISIKVDESSLIKGGNYTASS